MATQTDPSAGPRVPLTKERVLRWVVVIEDPRRGVLDRVLRYAAVQPSEAETLARGMDGALGCAPQEYRCWPQPTTAVSGLRGAVSCIDRIVLRRIPGPTS